MNGTGRAQTIQSLLEGPLDVLVIGGGIVGAGIARDAAMRGLRVGLVERHDFAFGASSRSSRLLHGGVRYLAQGRLGLVRQASVEKRILHHIARHLAEPLAFVFPAYRGTDWPLWQLRIGVTIYDLLCGGRNFGKSSSMTFEQVVNRVPGLEKKQLTGAMRYFDGLTNDARLVLDTLRSAARHGATVMNYLKFKNASHATDGPGWVCELEDQLNLAVHQARANAVINATGPWADGLPHSNVKLRLTKGIHLVTERKRLPLPEAMVITQGKRILFVIPWGERLIIGTTDTDYQGSLDDVRAQPEDIAYLLRALAEFFPSAALSEADIIATWAGLRPLLADGVGAGGPSDISRAHQIRTPEPGWWDVAGGKLTTYRLMAEQAVNEIVGWLNKVNELNGEMAPCRTAEEPLLAPADTEGVSGILPPKFIRATVEHYCANEWAVHLDDVMVRRSNWHYYFREAPLMAEQVVQWMGESLGWSAERRALELERYERV